MRTSLAIVGFGALNLATALTVGGPAHTAVRPAPAVTGHILGHYATSTPPTSAQCLAETGSACYSPAQIEQHYDLASLYSHRFNGAGKTIVIVDSFGSPTVQRDLHKFDVAFGLPDPALSIIQPAGAVPPFDPNNSDMVGWAEETALDVEWSHAIAPGASIMLVETPVSETEGVMGFPEIVKAENYVVDHRLGDVISQSFGATEETFPRADSITDLRGAYENAADHHVSVLAATGDYGATNPYADGSCCYPFPTVLWPASDPLVTALGGTEVHPRSDGNPQVLSRDTVWDGTGGGLSVVFSRPKYQNSVAGRVGKSRGIPDVAMSASGTGAVIVYMSFLPDAAGYYQIGGTSEATPIFAGIVAIADQFAGFDLGPLNKRLYALSRAHDNGIVDITRGNNSVTFLDTHNHDRLTTVAGDYAVKGYDLASGLGTIDAALFIPALARSR